MAIVGWALLGALAVFSILLCVPVAFAARYRTDQPVDAYIRWLVFRYDLTKPEKEPKKKAEKEKPEKPAKPKKPKAQKKPVEFSETLEMVVDLLSSLKGGGGMLLRRFRFSKLRLHMVVAEEDAAQTAIAYGRANALVYSALAAAQGFLNMAPPDIQIRPDFIAESGTVDFEARARLAPIVAVAAALRIGAAFLIRSSKRRAKEPPAEKETPRENAKQEP